MNTDSQPSSTMARSTLSGNGRINRLGFGALRLVAGTYDGPPRDAAAGVAVLRRAVELGVNHVDTAGFYGRGGVHAHELIRRALSPYPDDLLIATKVGHLWDADGTPTGQAKPGQLRGLIEDDLRRLGVDRLGLAYLRAGGMDAPGGERLGERFSALAELQEEGLIRHLGLSHVDDAQLAEARSIAPVAAVQNQFHVHHRQDVDLLEQCQRLGIAYVPFFPLGGGDVPLRADVISPIAARHRASVAQIALAWLRARSPAILTIPGTGSRTHLEENMGASAVTLTAEEMTELAPAP